MKQKQAKRRALDETSHETGSKPQRRTHLAGDGVGSGVAGELADEGVVPGELLQHPPRPAVRGGGGRGRRGRCLCGGGGHDATRQQRAAAEREAAAGGGGGEGEGEGEEGAGAAGEGGEEGGGERGGGEEGGGEVWGHGERGSCCGRLVFFFFFLLLASRSRVGWMGRSVSVVAWAYGSRDEIFEGVWFGFVFVSCLGWVAEAAGATRGRGTASGGATCSSRVRSP